MSGSELCVQCEHLRAWHALPPLPSVAPHCLPEGTAHLSLLPRHMGDPSRSLPTQASLPQQRELTRSASEDLLHSLASEGPLIHLVSSCFSLLPTCYPQHGLLLAAVLSFTAPL